MSVAVPVLLLFPIDGERVVVVLRVSHLRPDRDRGESGATEKKKTNHVLRLWVSESHQRVPLVPAGWDMADIACVLLPVLMEAEIESDCS